LVAERPKFDAPHGIEVAKKTERNPVGDPLNDLDGHRGAGADGDRCDTMRLPARRWARGRR